MEKRYVALFLLVPHTSLSGLPSGQLNLPVACCMVANITGSEDFFEGYLTLDRLYVDGSFHHQIVLFLFFFFSFSHQFNPGFT